MKYQLVKTDYDMVGESNDIFFYARNENNEKKKIRIIGFEPYFYVPHGEQVLDSHILSQTPHKYLSVYNEELDKITTRIPRYVGEMRNGFSRHYESDIKFTDRLMLDKGIFSGFEIPDDKTIVRHDKVKPCDFKIQPRVVVCDIETFSKGVRFPKPDDKDAMVTINGLYDYTTDFYISFVVDPKGKLNETRTISENHKAFIVPTEKDLIEKTQDYLKLTNPDIFTAWYVDFDKEYLDIRAEQHHEKFPWESTDVFDLLKAYKRLYSKGSNKLSDVVEMEKLDVPNYEAFQHEFWENDLKKAILINKSHVEACVKLNNKLKILDFYHNLKTIAGLSDMSGTVYHGILIETLLLRKYHNKFIVPSKPSDEEKSRRKQQAGSKKGGKVFSPPFGIFEGVGVFDMSRYYPEMIISQNLSPEPHSDLGIVPQLTLDLIEERLKYDKELKTLEPNTQAYEQLTFRRNAVKFLLNSIFGYFGHESSRLYDLDIFNSITKQGQRGLEFLQKKFEKDGYRLIYGDTDSLFGQLPKNKCESYVDVLNNSLLDFGKQENMTRKLSLKFEYWFSKIIFKKKREKINGVWVERGAKKRYAGKISYQSGKEVDYLKIVGFEYVRRDTSKETKRLQPKVIDIELSDKSKEEVKSELSEFIKTEVQNFKEGIKSGKLTLDDISIPKTLSKSLSKYGRIKNGKVIGIPDYARGAIYCNEWFGTDIRGGDQVKMVYVDKIRGYPKNDVLCYLSMEDIPVVIDVNIDKMIDRCIKGTLEGIVELAGLSWNDIFCPSKSLFGEFK